MDEHEAREGVQTAGTRRGYLPFLAEPALRAFSLRSNTVQEGGHQAVGSTTRLFIHVHGTAAARPLARRESRPDGSGTWPEQGFFAKIRVKSTEQAKSPNMLNTVICGGVELPSIQNDRDVPG